MSYIIDGHNLISKIHGLDLSMPDDEQRLIELLIRYSQESHHKLEVYFDAAPLGQTGTRNYGLVKTHFVAHSWNADEAIRRRLIKLGRSALNWVVVTSDRAVQQAAREAHAKVIRSEDFARLLQTALQSKVAEAPDITDQPLSEAEIEEWLRIFKRQGNQKQH